MNCKIKGGDFVVAFKQMWEDVCRILSNEKTVDIAVGEQYTSGFTIEEQGFTTFITREDFVDFWCKMLYYNEVSLEQVEKDEKKKQKYIYSIVRQLPYVLENGEGIKLKK